MMNSPWKNCIKNNSLNATISMRHTHRCRSIRLIWLWREFRLRKRKCWRLSLSEMKKKKSVKYNPEQFSICPTYLVSSSTFIHTLSLFPSFSSSSFYGSRHLENRLEKVDPFPQCPTTATLVHGVNVHTDWIGGPADLHLFHKWLGRHTYEYLEYVEG
jgi:hypothetical protein